MIKWLSSLLMLVLPYVNGLAQNTQVGNSTRITSFNTNLESLNDTLASPSPTSLDTLTEHARFYNPADPWIPAAAQQGNIGQACKPLIPSFIPDLLFQASPEGLKPWLYRPNAVKFYLHDYPFTDIRYVMGGKKEQFLEVIHSQNIGKLITAGANVRIINSPGSYSRQKSDIANLAISLQFNPRLNWYRAAASFTQNVLKLQENGGIQHDSLFEKNTQPDKRTITVNLPAAETRFRESYGNLSQDFRLLSDTVISKSALLPYLPLRLRLQTQYSEHHLVYEDNYPFSPIYPFYPLSADNLQDRLKTKVFTNKIFFSNYGHKHLSYYLASAYQTIDIQTGDLRKTYGQTSFQGSLKWTLPRHFQLKTEGQAVSGGYQNNDRTAFIAMVKRFHRKGKHLLTLQFSSRKSSNETTWTSQYRRGNLFNWTNQFGKTHTSTQAFDLASQYISIGGSVHKVRDQLVFLPGSKLPFQVPEQILIQQYYLRLVLPFNKVVIENRIDYQNVDKDQWVRLPEFISRHSVYLNLSLFRGALKLQPGIDLYYQSEYYADAYMPATHSFYLQNEKKLSDQVLADIFVNLKVGSARIFIKYSHFNALFGPVNYYQIPHYPLQDAAFRFGIFWLLRDLPDTGKKVTGNPER